MYLNAEPVATIDEVLPILRRHKKQTWPRAWSIPLPGLPPALVAVSPGVDRRMLYCALFLPADDRGCLRSELQFATRVCLLDTQLYAMWGDPAVVATWNGGHAFFVGWQWSWPQPSSAAVFAKHRENTRTLVSGDGVSHAKLLCRELATLTELQQSLIVRRERLVSPGVSYYHTAMLLGSPG